MHEAGLGVLSLVPCILHAVLNCLANDPLNLACQTTQLAGAKQTAGTQADY
jgi:hypothetical protein